MTDTAHKGGQLVLLGGGQHATVVADSARAAGWRIAGFFDDDPHCPLAASPDLRYLGTLADAPSYVAALTETPSVHAATGDPDRRRTWLDVTAEWSAPPVVHPSAAVSPSASVGPGVFIGPQAVVNAHASIGRGAIVNSGAIVEHDCALGPFCHVAPGAVLAGNVTIGEATLIGAGAVVNPSLHIGDRTILGAGAVAVHHLPDGVTAMGVPARIVPVADSRG